MTAVDTTLAISLAAAGELSNNIDRQYECICALGQAAVEGCSSEYIGGHKPSSSLEPGAVFCC